MRIGAGDYGINVRESEFEEGYNEECGPKKRKRIQSDLGPVFCGDFVHIVKGTYPKHPVRTGSVGAIQWGTRTDLASTGFGGREG